MLAVAKIKVFVCKHWAALRQHTAHTSPAVQHMALLRVRMANALLQVSFVACLHLRVRAAQRLQMHIGTAAKDRVELQLCHMRSSWLLRSRAAGVPLVARVCCSL